MRRSRFTIITMMDDGILARTGSIRLLLQIAAMNPEYISSDNIPEDILNKEKEIIKGQMEQAGREDDMEACTILFDGLKIEIGRVLAILSQSDWIEKVKMNIKQVC